MVELVEEGSLAAPVAAADLERPEGGWAWSRRAVLVAAAEKVMAEACSEGVLDVEAVTDMAAAGVAAVEAVKMGLDRLYLRSTHAQRSAVEWGTPSVRQLPVRQVLRAAY